MSRIPGSQPIAQSFLIENNPADELTHLVDLERRHQTAQNVLGALVDPEATVCPHQADEAFDLRQHVDNQFAIRIASCFATDDPERGYQDLKDIKPATATEQKCVSIDPDTFMSLYRDNQDQLTADADEIERLCVERFGSTIAQTDRYQFSGRGRRGIAAMREQGVEILLSEAEVDAGISPERGVNGTTLPLIESNKNRRLLSVCGFGDTKVGTAVHDVIDHMWTFDYLDKVGLLDKFGDMFDAVGDPGGTDIFKREGEIVAAISFGLRLLQVTSESYSPMIQLADVRRIFNDYHITGKLGSRHQKARQILNEVRPGSREQLALEFGISSYLAELDEQRRKYGRIKQRGTGFDGSATELDPLGPDYLSFFIEANRALMRAGKEHQGALLRTHALLEGHLESVASGKIPPDQVINLGMSELNDLDIRSTDVPPRKLEWMARNFGFSATRSCMADRRR